MDVLYYSVVVLRSWLPNVHVVFYSDPDNNALIMYVAGGHLEYGESVSITSHLLFIPVCHCLVALRRLYNLIDNWPLTERFMIIDPIYTRVSVTIGNTNFHKHVLFVCLHVESVNICNAFRIRKFVTKLIQSKYKL